MFLKGVFAVLYLHLVYVLLRLVFVLCRCLHDVIKHDDDYYYYYYRCNILGIMQMLFVAKLINHSLQTGA